MNGNSREEILGRIRIGLHKKTEHAETGNMTQELDTVDKMFSEVQKKDNITSIDSLLEQLIEELANVNTEVHTARNIDEIYEYIKGVIRRKGIKSFTAWDSEYLRSLNLNRLLEGEGLEHIISNDKYKIAEAQIGITGVDHAIADTGTLALLTDGSKPRSVSLLPPIHLAIVREANIVSNINELFTILKQTHDAGNPIPSCMTFITGPSRTADIELNLTLGVHGPKELYVIIAPD